MQKLTNINVRLRAAVLAFGFTLLSVLTPWFGLVKQAHALAPSTPVNVRLMTGGNSVAVLWEPAAGSPVATSYKIYRAGTLKATVNPVNNNLSQGNTERWLDTTVVNATAYSYQVSAVNVDGESVKTTAKSITHTTSPAVPTVTIDPSTPATLTTFANNAKALVQAWYPKIVWSLGNPAGTSSTITLKPIPGLPDNIAQQVGNTIEYSQEWAEANVNTPSALGVFLHEVTHLAQLSGTGTNYLVWAHEGMADYMEHYLYGDNNNMTPTLTGTNDTWISGYEHSAYMLNYVTKTFNKPNFVKDFDASFNPTYDINFFKNQTGLTVGQLWQQISGRRVSSATFFKNVNASFQCLEVTGYYYRPPAFAPPKLATCNNGHPAQHWEFIPDDSTGTSADNSINKQGEIRIFTLPTSGTCLDVYGSGITAGTRVYTYPCNNGLAQKWQMKSNGALMNPNSGMCLQPIAKATTAGTGMEIAACDGTTSQDWFIRPIGSMKTQSSFSCVSVSTLNPVQLYACGDGVPWQAFNYTQATPGAVSGQLKSGYNSKCLQPISGSTAVDANMEFVACTSATTQQWQWQSDLKVKNIGSGLCLTVPPVGTSPRLLSQTSCTVQASPVSLKRWDPLYQY